MFNHVGLLGRLAQEPEIRYTTGGTPVARFDLAVPVPSKKKDTPPDYIPVVCWDKWADFCGKYLTKGRQVVVEGRITTRKWQDNDGKHRKAVEVSPRSVPGEPESQGAGAETGKGSQARRIYRAQDRRRAIQPRGGAGKDQGEGLKIQHYDLGKHSLQLHRKRRISPDHKQRSPGKRKP